MEKRIDQDKQFSRRRFLLLGCGTLCAAALGSGCASRQADSAQASSCPYGLVNDPYPGRCHRYVDWNENGICDYSEPVEEAAVGSLTDDVGEPEPALTAAPIETPGVPAAPVRASTRCPRRLVNDPYPGRCRLYTDRAGNGICDLSESV